MGDSVKIWCFVALFPVFLAIGNDFYVNYLSTPDRKARLENLDIDPSEYMASDLGYLLTKHTPDALKSARAEIDPQTWKRNIDPILQQDAYIVAAVPAVLFYIYLLFAFVTGLPPYRGRRFGKQTVNSNYDGVLKDRDQKNQIKYKRR